MHAQDDVRVENIIEALRAVFYRLQVSQSSCAVGASLPASLRSLRFLATQPQLTAFARALGVCRVESWHRERRAGSLRGSAGDDDDDDFSMLFADAKSRSCTGRAAQHPVRQCALIPGPQRVIFGAIGTC